MKKAHYDSYDYPSYWKGRDYEHESEVIALEKFFKLIPHAKSIADIGAGFGRLTDTYLKKTNKVYLVEPSSTLLKVASDKFGLNKKVNYLNMPIEDVKKNIPAESLDTVLMVRVMHHLRDPKYGISILNSVLKKQGYLILEFANKIHGKAVFKNICAGDFTFPIDLSPSDMRCIENKNSEVIPFYNYHPDIIMEALEEMNFKIIKKLSVSNVRSSAFKRYVPFEALLKIEDVLQNHLSGIYFGPSIFVLAQKQG